MSRKRQPIGEMREIVKANAKALARVGDDHAAFILDAMLLDGLGWGDNFGGSAHTWKRMVDAICVLVDIADRESVGIAMRMSTSALQRRQVAA